MGFERGVHSSGIVEAKSKSRKETRFGSSLGMIWIEKIKLDFMNGNIGARHLLF